MSSDSQFIINGTDTVTKEWQDLELLHRHGAQSLYKVKQYGHWYILKTALSSDTTACLRLQKEFALAVELDHPHIVHTLEYGQDERVGEYIRMEWIDGCTLADFLATNPSKKIRIRLLKQLLDAVTYLHSHQTVHRDLKPTNIMVTKNGNNIKLIDFGVSDTDDFAVFKQPAGTLSYMAPEQTTALQTDIRMDIYAVGKLMLLIAPFYAHVAHKCLRERAEDRYASCEEILHAIHYHQSARIWVPVALLFSLLLSLTSYFCYVAFFRSDPREAVIQQAHALIDEQYTHFVNQQFTSFIDAHQSILDFYARCYSIRDSVASTIDDQALKNDFIQAHVIYSGQKMQHFSDSIETAFNE